MSSDTDSIVESVESGGTNAQSSATNTKTTKDYKFFRSLSVKVDSWPVRKAEQLWRRLRDNRLAGWST